MPSEPAGHPNDKESFDDILRRLRQPLTDLKELTSLLEKSHAALADASTGHDHTTSRQHGDFRLISMSMVLQEVTCQHVLPIWFEELQRTGSIKTVDRIFGISGDRNLLQDVLGICAFQELGRVVEPTVEYSKGALPILIQQYPINVAARIILGRGMNSNEAESSSTWASYLRIIFGLPGKTLNAYGVDGVPLELQHSTYFLDLMKHCELLFHDWSNVLASTMPAEIPAQMIEKLIVTGFFPASPSLSLSEPDYFTVNIETMHQRISDAPDSPYCTKFISMIDNLSSTSANKVLLSYLGRTQLGYEDHARPSSPSIALQARRLYSLFGAQDREASERWERFSGVVLSRSWNERFARVVVRWIQQPSSSAVDNRLEELIQRALELWTSSEYVKYSLPSRHRFMTTILILAVSRLSPSSDLPRKMASSPAFAQAVGSYIGHPETSIRRCGMLAAEIVAKRAGQKLEFGDWDGDDPELEWCRKLRMESEIQDFTLEEDHSMPEEIIPPANPPLQIPTELKVGSQPRERRTDDSDDESLSGYSSPSSRSASPTPSELQEIEADPSLVMGRRKISRPVYLLQLLELINTKRGEEQSEVDRHEVFLDEGARLIRHETAIELTTAFAGLQDNYELIRFEEKRLAALTALVACKPKRVAPHLIELFFTGAYSSSNRSTLLTALVNGARELAGIDTTPQDSSQFPSKMLPPALHQKYANDEDVKEQMSRIMDGITREAIATTRQEAEVKVPQIMRERQLKIHRFSTKFKDITTTSFKPAESFVAIAAEFFVMPMIERFWIHLRDQQTREYQSRFDKTRYKGSGSGTILNTGSLGQFLMALSILLHAASHSPAFRSILAPQSIELALTLGTRAPSASQDKQDSVQGRVLAAALELTLVALDLSKQQDEGKTLAKDHPTLLMGVKEWAEKILEALEMGISVEEAGGEGEIRIRRASAGVTIILNDIIGKWRLGIM